MSKILLIIQREYLTRVRKKSFIIMSLLTPVLIGGVFAALALLLTVSDEKKTIAVIDKGSLLEGKVENDEHVELVFIRESLEEAKRKVKEGEYSAVLSIPAGIYDSDSVTIFHAEKQPSINVIEYVQTEIQKRVEAKKLVDSGVDQALVEEARTDIKVGTTKISERGEESSSSGAATGIGYICGVLIYFFIFLYGAQVMRGVIEEKTNRIVEVIISSVKPFELMMGKVIGIGLVALTQFVLWIVLTATINIAGGRLFLKDKAAKAPMEMSQGMGSDMDSPAAVSAANTTLFNLPGNINVVKILVLFTFYFLGGYLLYAALFAAIGSAVDSEADTQQFMLPVTIPLILSFLVAQYAITSPDGPIAFWFSIIPFTSPIVMIVRVAFDAAPLWELLLSMALLVLGFLGATWLAGRIYRTGILMYGKKTTYREIGKWLFYRR
jgi:ABC-2 type transport system permease protein